MQGRVARCEDRFLILCHAWTDGKPLLTAERNVRSLLAAFPGERDAVASGVKAELKNYVLSNQITKGGGRKKTRKPQPNSHLCQVDPLMGPESMRDRNNK